MLRSKAPIARADLLTAPIAIGVICWHRSNGIASIHRGSRARFTPAIAHSTQNCSKNKSKPTLRTPKIPFWEVRRNATIKPYGNIAPQ